MKISILDNIFHQKTGTPVGCICLIPLQYTSQNSLRVFSLCQNPTKRLRLRFSDWGAEDTRSTSHSASQFQRFLPLDLFPAGYATAWQTVQRAILRLQWKSNFYRTCCVSIKSCCSARGRGKGKREKISLSSLGAGRESVRSTTLGFCYTRQLGARWTQIASKAARDGERVKNSCRGCKKFGDRILRAAPAPLTEKVNILIFTMWPKTYHKSQTYKLTFTCLFFA